MSVLGPTTEFFLLLGIGNCSMHCSTSCILAVEKKKPKKKPPQSRLDPALLALDEGFRKGLPSPSENERHPCRSPAGCFSPNTAMLGTGSGDKRHAFGIASLLGSIANKKIRLSLNRPLFLTLMFALWANCHKGGYSPWVTILAIPKRAGR